MEKLNTLEIALEIKLDARGEERHHDFNHLRVTSFSNLYLVLYNFRELYFLSFDIYLICVLIILFSKWQRIFVLTYFFTLSRHGQTLYAELNLWKLFRLLWKWLLRTTKCYPKMLSRNHARKMSRTKSWCLGLIYPGYQFEPKLLAEPKLILTACFGKLTVIFHVVHFCHFRHWRTSSNIFSG